MKNELNILKLKTIKNFALQNSVTPAYIYKLIKSGRLTAVTIDGVLYIDTSIHPALKSK